MHDQDIRGSYELRVICQRCDTVLWERRLTDEFGLIPVAGMDELRWLRAATGDEWPVRPRDHLLDDALSVPGWKGPDTSSPLPTYTEYDGGLKLYFHCPSCGATPLRRLG